MKTKELEKLWRETKEEDMIKGMLKTENKKNLIAMKFAMETERKQKITWGEFFFEIYKLNVIAQAIKCEVILKKLELGDKI